MASATEEEFFGAVMCVGHTLGEEIIFERKKSGQKVRMESVVARTASCVLQVSTRVLFQLKRLKDRT